MLRAFSFDKHRRPSYHSIMTAGLDSKRLGSVVLVASCLMLVGNYAGEATGKVERAQEAFRDYARALLHGSLEEASRFWNRKEVETYAVYDWQWGYLALRQPDHRQLNYRITEAEDRGGYVSLRVEWYYGEGRAGPIQTDERYFVKADGRMVGANPIFVHTEGWLDKESEHFVYHYKSEEEEPDHVLLDCMDRFYERTVKALRVDYQDKVDYYKCDSVAEVGQLFGLEGSLARSYVPNGVVASVSKSAPHEIVHVISYRMLPQEGLRIQPEYLDEGLAYYLGGASFFSPDLLLFWAKQELERKPDIALDSLVRNPWRYGANEGAGLTASFAKFLIDTRGILRLKGLFAAGHSAAEQREALRAVFRKSLSEVRQEWETFVLGMSLPEVRIDEPINCTRICYVKDQEGDDTGDGDYTYPKNQKALPGIFDLTGLKLSLDDEMVYFKLEFADLNREEVSSDEAFNGTFAAIAIDSDGRKNSGSTELQFENGQVRFHETDAYEFVIEVSNAGVLLYDQNWVWQAMFLRAFSLQSHIRENEIYFALPRSLIGTPDSTWKIQVLSGGQKGGHKKKAYGVGRFAGVGLLPSADQGGGGTDTEFNPDVYDMLTAEGMNQIEILRSYDAARKTKATIPMIRLNAE